MSGPRRKRRGGGGIREELPVTGTKFGILNPTTSAIFILFMITAGGRVSFSL
jgi:hypothetical protein